MLFQDLSFKRARALSENSGNDQVAIEFSAAHWWSVRARGPKVWGSIYHGNSDFFSAPRL